MVSKHERFTLVRRRAINVIPEICILSALLLSCSDLVSVSKWNDNVKSNISHVDFNLEYLANVQKSTIGAPIFGLNFFVEFKSDPSKIGFDSMKILSRDPGFKWKVNITSANIHKNSLSSGMLIARGTDFGSTTSFPLGEYRIILFSKGNQFETIRNVYLRNDESQVQGLSNLENQILAIPRVRTISSDSDSLRISFLNRDSNTIHYAALGTNDNASETILEGVELPSRAGNSEYSAVFKRPMSVSTVYVKIYSKVLREINSDYVSNSHPIRLSDNTVIPGLRWVNDTSLASN